MYRFAKQSVFYCDFNSFACRDDFVPAYFNALKKEISAYSDIIKGYRIKTVFFGGEHLPTLERIIYMKLYRF